TGGGSVSRTSAITDNTGSVSVIWTLGGFLGAQTLTVSAGSLPPAVVGATGTVGPPALLLPVAGNTQFAVVGRPVPIKPRVRLTDAFGNPIAGRSITFTVTTGGGTITDSVQTTNASGEVELGSWTLGPGAGNNRLRAFLESINTELLAIGTPASVVVFQGNSQTVNAGTQVPVKPAVLALGPDGEALADVAIVFQVDAGGGQITGPSQTTDAQGIARLGNWILGTTAGENRVSATTFGLAAVSFTATGIAANPAVVTAATPTSITGLVGNFLSSNPAVRVTDGSGNPVAAVPVTFEVVTGGGVVASAGFEAAFGLLAAAGATTDFDGRAQLGAWRLGSTPGDQSVRVNVGSLPPMTFTATAEPVPVGTYQIEVRFTGTQPSAAQQNAFTSAAARWQELVLNDLPDETFNEPATSCSPELNEVIDDLVIFAELTTIDGLGGVLGSAGPCWIRDETGLTVVGRMRFDTADLASLETSGHLGEVILHEMGHVVGFGTLWSLLGLIEGAGGGDPTFVGSSSRSAWVAASQSLGFVGNIVPVENSGGPGTRDGHWRETVARNELMTGFINNGTNPLSAFSVASFRDMGYVVNDAASDQFILTQLLLGTPAAQLQIREAPLAGPIYVIDRAGRRAGTRSRIPF
ncbi:MAG TPA: Ig-like domain-containing protein, partial [Gemmatimonadales bacterium]